MGKLSQPLAAVTEEVPRRHAVFARERSHVALPFGEGARRAGKVNLFRHGAYGGRAVPPSPKGKAILWHLIEQEL